MSSTSTVSSFFFYTFFVTPIMSWIMKPQRFKRKRALTLALTFLTILGLANLGMIVWEMKSNYYHLLQVPTSASATELKRSFRKQSIHLHPDKNLDNPEATSDFARLQQAYEVLADAERRRVYDRFGEEEALTDPLSMPMNQLIELVTFYVMWGVMAYFVSCGSNSGQALTWVYLMQTVMLTVDLNLKFGAWKLPDTMFSQMTSAEMIKIMHSMYPLFLNGAQCIGQFLYLNLELDNIGLSIELLKADRALALGIRNLHADVLQLQSNPNRPMTTSSSKVLENPNVRHRKSKKDKHLTAEEQKAQVEAETKARVAEEADPLLNPQPDIQKPGFLSRIPGTLWFFLAYAVYEAVMGW